MARNEKVKIVALAGSTREGSYNKKLAKIAAQAAQAAGADVSVIDLRDFPLPLFDEDLEKRDGAPDSAKKIKDILKFSDGFLIASPEYNSSITGVLKNTIDWTSRPSPDEPPLVCFQGKTAAIMSASPGGLGGLRGLVTLRSILGNIGVLVLPNQVSVSKAHEAFNADGSLKDAQQTASIKNLAAQLVSTLQKLNN